MNEPNLSDFVVFGVGIAGFASIVVALGHRRGRLSEYDRFRVVQLFICSLIPAFLALLQEMLVSFGIRGQDAYRISGVAFMVAIIADICIAIIMARRMSAPSRSSLSPIMWRIGLAFGLVIVVWNALNLVGWPRPLSLGPVVAGMMGLFLYAAIVFFRLLLVRVGAHEHDAIEDPSPQ